MLLEVDLQSAFNAEAFCAFVREHTDWNTPLGDIALLYSLPIYTHALVEDSQPEKLVASAAAIRMEGFTFLCYVIVSQAWRRKGLGRRVVVELMAKMEEREHILIASRMGAPMYEALGYRDASSHFKVCLFQLDGDQAQARLNDESDVPVGLRAFNSESCSTQDLNAAVELVARASGGAPHDTRSEILRFVTKNGAEYAGFSEGGDSGTATSVCFARPNHSDGLFVGPLVASSIVTGCALLDEIVRRCRDRGRQRGKPLNLSNVFALGVVRMGDGLAELVFEKAGFKNLFDVPLLMFARGQGGNVAVADYLDGISPRYMALAGYELV